MQKSQTNFQSSYNLQDLSKQLNDCYLQLIQQVFQYQPDFNQIKQKYQVDDLIIKTEHYYTKGLCEKYIEENKDYFNEIENLLDQSQRNYLKNMPVLNQVIKKAQNNYQSIQKYSLLAILKSGKFKLQNKQNFIHTNNSDITNQLLQISTQQKVKPIFKNTLLESNLPIFKFDFSKENYQNYSFIQFSVYSQITCKKYSEFIISIEEPLQNLFNTIECIVTSSDKQKYNRFLCLDNHLFVEKNPTYNSLDEELVFLQIKQYKPNFQLLYLQSQKIKELQLSFDKVYIFRDNIGCDHMIIFTNLLIGNQLNENLKEKNCYRIFIPQFKVRKCEVCKNKKAVCLTKNSKINSNYIIFLCQQCYLDFHFDEQLINKLEDYYVSQYFYEEK